jgi:hypothetical protein
MMFDRDDMITALQAWGYEVKEDTESQDINWNGTQTEVRSVKVYNAYRHGKNMTSDRHWEGGLDRIKWVFEREMRRRLIQLLAVKD